MSGRPIAYWDVRVMRHHLQNVCDEYAIHEVYFGDDNTVVVYTQDALSPRAPNILLLSEALLSLLEQSDEAVICGDLQYAYSKAYVQEWLAYIEIPPIDYETKVEVV